MTFYDVIEKAVTVGTVTDTGIIYYTDNVLENGTICIGKKPIMQRYQIIPQKLFFADDSAACVEENMPLLPDGWEKKNPYDLLEELYGSYYHSIPGKEHGREHFFALPEQALTFADFKRGIERNRAQALLEGYVILAACLSLFPFSKGWYWQSGKYDRLVIYKSWVQI